MGLINLMQKLLKGIELFFTLLIVGVLVLIVVVGVIKMIMIGM